MYEKCFHKLLLTMFSFFMQVELWVKAVDSSYNTQPENFENIWNLRGVLGTAYHRVIVNINEAKK
jgi:hypothetical protein